MNNGYIRVAAASIKTEVADCEKNADQIIEKIKDADAMGIKLLTFPELSICGYTVSDLFLQNKLRSSAIEALRKIIDQTKSTDVLAIVGLPLVFGTRLFNCAAAIKSGKLLGIVPKQNIPNYSEFYEARHFASGKGIKSTISLFGEDIPFGEDLIFSCENLEDFKVGIEICEDMWVPTPPSSKLCTLGATIIVNPSASTYVTGKDFYRTSLVTAQSGRCICSYILSSCGEGESSTDLVFSGHLLICENGKVLNSAHHEKDLIFSDIDTEILKEERIRTNTFSDGFETVPARTIPFNCNLTSYAKLERVIEKHPFVPNKGERYNERCREVLDIQCLGVAKRLEFTHAKTAVVAVSGGLDSTLSLLVTSLAIKEHSLKTKIIAITMPGPGTTGRTHSNASKLCSSLGAELIEIPIGEAVKLHLKDISHGGDFDTTYENVQARERTQIAMDIANKEGGLVMGTGDMSELALGFTTYNGDHMSMYGVNCSVPKTLVRHLIKYVADENSYNTVLHDTLYDILDTPVSPELLPPDATGKIAQKTEKIVGPYELHDFFLYYFLRFGFTPSKILRLATQAFEGCYEKAEIKRCLIIFIKRFFMSQYKRSCIPDGPKVGSIALSPRGDFRMPSDACVSAWIKELEE